MAVGELRDLDRSECLRLLAATSGRVGRLALSPPERAPMIRPVNYVYDDQSQSVLFRSAPGSALHAAGASATAAFEIDGSDPVERTGWSVIVVGTVEEVRDPAEMRRIEELELEPWAPGARGHWVRIRAVSASGRRIVRTFAPDQRA